MDKSDRVRRYQQQSRIADEMAGRGNKDESLRLLETLRGEAAAAGDEDYRAFFEAELINYSSDDYAAAAQRLAEGIGHAEQAGGVDAFLLRNLGVYHSLKGDEDAAIVWYDKALAENPKDWDAMRQKGVSLAKKGDQDAAIAWYDKALAENPKDWNAMWNKGVSLAEKGDQDVAIVWYDKALAENPKDGNAIQQKGVSLGKKGDLDAAIVWFDKALAENPKDGNAMRNKGVSLAEKGDMDASIVWYDKALAENPKDWNAMQQKGVSLSEKGDLDASIVWYDKALAENPKDGNAMRSKGVSLSKKGDMDASIVWFDKALAENPKDWNAMQQKGVSLGKKGDQDAAIVWFDKALAENPKDWNAMRQKGVSLAKKGNLDAAIAWYDKALAENPKDWDAMRSKGVSLAKKGDQDAAIVWFDKALAENPKDWDAMREKGVSLFNKGDMAAIDWIGKAAQQSPDRWRQDFLAVCKMTGRDANEAWRQLVGEAPAIPSPPQDPFGELRLMINTIRERLKEQATKYLVMKEREEARLAEFLEPRSRLANDRSLLMVLRKWNSYTPALPASPDDERSRGGGYFIWHNGHGTVIDPGFNFIENFHQAGGRMCDIHNIILTHAHPDHTAEFETLRTLLFEYNDNIHELNKKRAEQTPAESPFPSKRVRFFLNNGAFRKFAGMLDLREYELTDRVITLNRDSEFELLGGGRLRVLPAYHDELLSRDQAVGLLLTLGTKDEPRRILLTSDTGLFPLRPDTHKPTADASQPDSEIGKQYLKVVEAGKVDVMLVHIGSIKPDEFDTQKEQIADACYANHLGIIGTARVIAMCQPKLAVVSEFGEEMRDFRFALIKDLRDSVLTWYFQDKGGQSPQVVPGDLAFVYSIMDRTVLDCATRDWSPANEIDFWEDEAKDEKGIYYAKTIPPNDEKKRDCVNLFRSHRNAHDDMYFAKPQAAGEGRGEKKG